MSDPLITGRSENTPWRVHNRVMLVVGAAVVVFGAIAYTLWSVLN